MSRYAEELDGPGLQRSLQPGRRCGEDRLEYHLSRAQLDEYSVASHERAAAAQDEGPFVDEIVACHRGRRAVRRSGRGHPPRVDGREAGRAEGAVPRGWIDHRRERLTDLRRSRSAAGHDVRARQGARPDTTRPGPHRRCDGRRSGQDADRPDPRHRAGAEAFRPRDRRDRCLRGQRGVRPGSAGLADRDRCRRRTASTLSVVRSHWDIHSAPLVPVLRPRWCTTFSAQVAATVCRRCAKEPARPTRRSTSGSDTGSSVAARIRGALPPRPRSGLET